MGWYKRPSASSQGGIVSKQFYLDYPESEALKKLAEERGVNQSQLLREMVKATLERGTP